MGGRVDRWESLWIDCVIVALLVTGVAALAMIQSRQPARRRTWGRCGLIASLAIVPLVALNPLPKVNLKHPAWILRGARPRPSPPVVGAVAVLAADEEDGAPDEPTPEAAVATTWREALGLWMRVAYGAGVVLALGWVALGWAGTRYLTRRAGPASGRAEALLAGLPFARGRRPRILVSPSMRRPVLVGIRRPVILIPPALDRPGLEPQLRLGLLHELAHAEMRDHWFGPVAALAHACWFFLPQVWWIRSQLRLDAEYLADHRAVGSFGTSYGYAESLFGIAFDPDAAREPGSAPARPPAGPAVAAQPRRGGDLASALFRRMQMLLKCPFEVEDRPPRAWVAAVGLLFAGVTLAGSCLSIRDDHRPPASRAGLSGDANRAFHLANLVIAPGEVEGRPFHFPFPLPDQFHLACEVLATPAELRSLEVLDHPLAAVRPFAAPERDQGGLAWRLVEVVRDAQGLVSVRVDGATVVGPHLPARMATRLSIRTLPGRSTRFREIHLTWCPRYP